MALMMEMAQIVHDPVEERKVHESTPNEQPKHEHLVIEKFYKCQWTLCDRVFVGLEDLLNHALDVHGFDEVDGDDSDEVKVETIKLEDEQSTEQVNPIEEIHQDESTLSEIVSDGQSCATSHDHAYDHQIDHLPSAPLNESASLICLFAECVDLTFNHQPSLLRQFNANPDQFDSNLTQSTSSNQSKSNPMQSQPVSLNLNQFCANLEQFSPNLIEPEIKLNPTLEHTNLTLNPPITLSKPITSKRTSQFKKFKTHKDIILHYSNSVSKEFKFPCEECKKIINRNYPLVFLMSHLRTYHHINLDQLNLHQSNTLSSQPASLSLDQFSANLEQSSHCLNQFNINPKFISKPINLSMISSISTNKSNLDVDDQQTGNDGELLMNGLSGMTNSASILTTTIEINKEYHEEVITLHSNEGSSLHSSPTLFQPSSQQESKLYDDGELYEDNWDDEVRSIVRPALKILDKNVEDSWEAMDNDQNEEQDREHDQDILAIGNNLSDLTVMNGQMDDDMSENGHHVGNDEELLMDNQVSDDDENSDHGVDQLNGLVNGQMESDEGSDVCSEGSLIIDEDATEVVEDDYIGVDQLYRLENPVKRMRFEEVVESGEVSDQNEVRNDEAGEEYDDDETEVDENFDEELQENGHRPELQSNKDEDAESDNEHDDGYLTKIGQGAEELDEADNLIRRHPTSVFKRPFPCTWIGCNKSFTRNEQLQQHLKSHIKELELEQSRRVTHVCKECGKEFRFQSRLKIHLRTHTEERPFECPLESCNLAFTFKGHCFRHFNTHTGVRPDDIKKYLKRFFKTEKRLEDYLQTPIVHRCTWIGCNKILTRKEHLQRHLKTHANELKAKSQTVDFLLNPAETGEAKNDEVGEKYYADETDLDKEMDVDDQYGDDKLNGLEHRENMETTQVLVPDKFPKGKVVCKECNKVFRFQCELVIHMRTHTGEKPFSCTWEGCGKAFAQRYNLTTHEYTHTGAKPYQCPLRNCRKAFVQRSHMLWHLKAHNGVFPFVCENCGKGFTSKNTFDCHIRTHTGERPYECSFEGCNMRFALINSMRTHHMIHTGMRPHVCNHCRKGFQTSGNLKKHIRIHTGERSYEKHYRTHGSTTVHSIQAVSKDNN